MMDTDGRAWLIEVNVAPSMHAASPIDRRVKHGVAQDMVRILEESARTRSRNETVGGGWAGGGVRGATAGGFVPLRDSRRGGLRGEFLGDAESKTTQ